MTSRIALVGDNGCGKTTLVKTLMGEIEPITGMAHKAEHLRISYFT